MRMHALLTEPERSYLRARAVMWKHSAQWLSGPCKELSASSAACVWGSGIREQPSHCLWLRVHHKAAAKLPIRAAILRRLGHAPLRS